MVSSKKDFFAVEVIDAIKQASESFKVSQEELEIEVVETGSNGIFGLIKKKAHIRASVKKSEKKDVVDEKVSIKDAVAEQPVQDNKKTEDAPVKKVAKGSESVPDADDIDDSDEMDDEPDNGSEPVNEASAQLVCAELAQVLTLMGFPSDVTAEIEGKTVRCQIGGEYEEALTAQEGKIIDSLQYLMRKMAARKVEEKIRISIDVGQFREKRRQELIAQAKELAALVKEDGKTQAIPPLNPSERRIVHVALQSDTEIRSRSVGGGLFKKVLIFKPGKGKKPQGNKRGAKGNGGGSKKQGKSSSE